MDKVLPKIGDLTDDPRLQGMARMHVFGPIFGDETLAGLAYGHAAHVDRALGRLTLRRLRSKPRSRARSTATADSAWRRTSPDAPACSDGGRGCREPFLPVDVVAVAGLHLAVVPNGLCESPRLSRHADREPAEARTEHEHGLLLIWFPTTCPEELLQRSCPVLVGRGVLDAPVELVDGSYRRTRAAGSSPSTARSTRAKSRRQRRFSVGHLQRVAAMTR